MSAIKYYTDSFDKDMLDFIKHELQMEADNEDEWDVTHAHLVYSSNLSWYWTCKLNHPETYQYLTKQQFKQKIGMEKIGMTTKQFSKKDLVAGKHVVELADGSRYTLVNLLDKVVGFNLQADSKGVHDSWYTYLEEDLVYPYNKDLSVVVIYEVVNTDVYFQCSDRNIELIWKRSEKSATQIELEKLQQQIAELQGQANKLQSTL